MKKKELTLPEIQQASFEVLKEIAAICETKNFRYFLGFGTLLGAVRHKGFIPWDDDIDIFMPREDFDKFLDYLETSYKGKLVVSSRKNDPNYPYGIPRINDMNYEYVTSEPVKPWKSGVFVDIYPLDHCDLNFKKSSILFERCKLKNRIYSWWLLTGSENFPKLILKRVIGYFLRIVKGKNYNQRIDEEIKKIAIDEKSTETKDGLAIIVFGSSVHRIFDKTWFGEARLLFNGISFSVPSNYHEILKKTYGDYMTLPPEEKRKPTHRYKIYKRSA